MKQGGDIIALANTVGKFKFIFGTRNFTVVNNKIEDNGIFYKGFSFFLGIIIAITFFINIYVYYNEMDDTGIKHLLMILNIFSLYSTYANIIFPIIFSSTRKITFNLLIEIDDVLRSWKLVNNNHDIKITIFLLSIVIILKIFQTAFDIILTVNNSLFGIVIIILNLIVFVTELESISFLIEANLIARRLEILNNSLIRIGTKKFGAKVDFLGAGNNLLSLIWNKKHMNYSEKCFNDGVIEDFYEIYYKIFNAIVTLSSNYYFTVSIIYCTYFGKLME